VCPRPGAPRPRNPVFKLSRTTGVGRGYSVRLTSDSDLGDIAFPEVRGPVLLEAGPSSRFLGECLGSVRRLIAGPCGRRRQELGASGIKAMLRVPFDAGALSCEFCCESRGPREPSFELHASAELFAQMFAMQLELEQETNR